MALPYSITQLVIIFENGKIIRDATICVNCCISLLTPYISVGCFQNFSPFLIFFKKLFDLCDMHCAGKAEGYDHLQDICLHTLASVAYDQADWHTKKP